MVSKLNVIACGHLDVSLARQSRKLSVPKTVFDFGVVRTFRSAVFGRPEGLHYIGVEDPPG